MNICQTEALIPSSLACVHLLVTQVSSSRLLSCAHLIMSMMLHSVGSKTTGLYLDWPARSQIIKWVADGLLYLHKHCGLNVIHGDLKPSNIVLNSNMNPSISDFGFARMYNPGADEEFADHIVGSM
jgi:serine/threonine protein kinase